MKKRKMIMRRIVAVLLALVMIGSAVDMSGVTVHAEETESVAQIGETTYSSIEAAMEAAQSGETVIALADYTADFLIREGVIFDGGNFLFNGTIENYGTINGGIYNGTIKNYGTINGGIYNGFINNLGTINKATFNGLVGNNGTINNLNAGDILLGSSFSFIDNVGNVLCTAHIVATDCEEICRFCRQLNVSAALHTIGSDNKCTKCLNPAIARIDDRYFVSWRCLEVARNNATADNPVTVTALASNNGQFEIPQYVIFDGGSFTFNHVDNRGVIVGGVFSGLVRNLSNGTINGGVFNGGIINGGVINNLNTGDVILKDAEKYQDGGGTINCQAHYSDANCGETANCKLCNASFTQNHIWNYVASGSDISRICQRTCQVSQLLTLMAPDSNSLIYDGTEKEATITGVFVSEVNSSITYNTTGGSAPIYPGNYTASITLGDATASVSYEIGKATLTVTGATAVGREYDGTNRVKITDIALNGFVDSDIASVDFTNLWGTISSANVGTYSEVTLPELTLTGTHKDYYVLEQPTEAVPTNVTITKAAAPVIETVNREYVYSKENHDTVDIEALLPEDCGTVSYNVETSGSIAYTESLGVSDGVLGFALSAGQVDDENTVTVTATTQNYKDITVIVKLKLREKYPVSLKAGTEVTLQKDTLVYGDALSDLTFNSAVFVDGAGNPVAGSLAWKTPDAVLDAGTESADWIFTPADEEYASAEGTVAITVNKAVPNVVTVPTVTERVYNPSVALRDTDLNADGRVVGAEGSEIAGVWKWVTPSVPVAGSNGYEAEFTPEDAGNYEKVVRTVTVNVAKATPVITVLPTGSAITYGDMLCSSVLTGTAAYVADGPIVEGSFSWKSGTVKPAVADSNSTTYEVIFTPQDTANYNQVETTATLTVNKAENAPGTPGTAMSVSNRYTKVGEVPLATGWQWRDADKAKALEVETPVSAIAEYVAADKDNYENISVTVTITRAACDHVAGNVLYTGTGEKAPTCTASGLGHKECTKCGTVMESGIVVGTTGHSGELRYYEEPTCTTEGYSGDTYCSDCGSWLSGGVTLSVTGHNYVGVVTRKATTEREGVRTYTCSKCGDSYTESIAKLIADTTTEKPADKNDEKWEMVREELGVSEEGATVTVDMADTTVVPGTVFDDIKGKDITTTFVLENGITWSVNGKDITSEKVNDIDFGVKVGADANHTIPVEVINNVSGERTYTNISLAYEGEFGFKAVMALNMDAKNAGLFANLFYFNEQTNTLEFICADKIAEDGTAELTFTHASEYTIVMDTEEMSGALDSSDVADTTEPDTEVNVEPEAEADSTNGGSALWIILLVAVLAVAGVALVWKRKKN